MTRCYVLLLSGLALCPPVAQAAAPPLELGVTEKHVMVPMRDGKKLSVYLYFPAGKGPWPVLYEQRYADLRAAATRKSFARLAGAGYVVAAQNFRGTHLSEGQWVGYRALGWGKQQDGYDTVEWLAKQDWSTGKIGTFGSSQAGFAQNFLAVTRPPHLVCQYLIDTGLSLFHEGYRIGGTTRPQRFKQMDAVCRDPKDNQRLMREWFAHPTYDDYWAEEDCTRHFDRMNVPCFTVGSWYDFMCVGSVESYVGRQHRGGPRSRGTQQLLIGPWLHGRYKEINKVGDLTYPQNARFATEAHLIRWFDHHLKGKNNGVERDPAVRYYVMGAVGEKGAPGNEWRSADDWPVSSRSTPYYLHEGGKLSTRSPTEENSATTVRADPLRPNTIPGTAFPGAKDARPFEKQADVKTFTSEALTEPVEWTGKVKAELYVSSTAKDTDFIVRLSDVYPDGRSVLLMDYVRRARYRDGYDKEVLMEPGRVYKVAFDVGWTSQVFNKGHHIRITVASTGAPFYEPNPNTGEALTIEEPKKTVVAKNAVHHDRHYASRVLAPVRALADTAKSDKLPDYRPVVGWAKLPDDVKLGPVSAVATDSEDRVYVAHRGKRPILVFDADGKFIRSWGDKEIDVAHGLRVDLKGNVWVTDMGGQRVMKFSQEGKLLLALGKRGEKGDGPDRFNRPTDVAVTPSGDFYVSDGYGNFRVLKFSRDGKLLKQWGRKGKGEGEFNLPHAVCLDDKGRVYVGDRENNRVQVFDADGKFLAQWKESGAPYGLFLSKGRLFVADGRASWVKVLDLHGKALGRLGEKGAGAGQFTMPHMLCVDSKGAVYVAEVDGKRVQKFVARKE
jgi:predicted acyl esterase/DNA-binding beta-propeller fold protein YncE